MTETTEEYIDMAVEDLIRILPLLSKNLVRVMRDKTKHTPGALYLLGALIHHGDLNMSEIGIYLMMPKPNVTALVDRLISDKLVERYTDADDRRVIYVRITEKGAGYFTDIKAELSRDLREKLRDLESDQIESLARSSRNVREILKWSLQSHKQDKNQ